MIYCAVVCKYWLQGYCSRGDSCAYMHQYEADALADQMSTMHVKRSQKPNYEDKGMCVYRLCVVCCGLCIQASQIVCMCACLIVLIISSLDGDINQFHFPSLPALHNEQSGANNKKKRKKKKNSTQNQQNTPQETNNKSGDNNTKQTKNIAKDNRILLDTNYSACSWNKQSMDAATKLKSQQLHEKFSHVKVRFPLFSLDTRANMCTFKLCIYSARKSAPYLTI